LLGVAAFAYAQEFGWFRGEAIVQNHPPPTEFIAARLRFGTNGAIGHMGWAHNYPYSDQNLNRFLDRTTLLDVEPMSYRIVELGSDEVFDHPFAYVSEPGEMELTEEEVLNLREYVDRGGFILIDDFDTWHMDNLREEMLRVFPDRAFQRMTVDNPIFDLAYAVESLDSMAPYVQGDDPVYYSLDNSVGQIAIIALHNNDFANFWEWYGSPGYPLRPATDAFRMGTNFIVYSMTH
jgi:hypothetical protein